MPSSGNTASAVDGDHHDEAPSLLDTDEELAALDPAARMAMLQGMADRSARAARGEVFGPPVPVPLHGPQPGTPRASGARSSPPPIRRRSRSPRVTHQPDHPPAPETAATESTPTDANYFVEIRVDPSWPIHLCLQIRILPAEVASSASMRILFEGAALSQTLAEGSCPTSAGALSRGTPPWSAARFISARLMENPSGSLLVDSQQADASTHQTGAAPPPSPTDHELEQAAQEAEYRTLEVLLGSTMAPEVKDSEATAAATGETDETLAEATMPISAVSDRRRNRSRSRARAVANYTLETPSAAASITAYPCLLTALHLAICSLLHFTQDADVTVPIESSTPAAGAGFASQDEVQVVADLINVPDADQTSNDTKDTKQRRQTDPSTCSPSAQEEAQIPEGRLQGCSLNNFAALPFNLLPPPLPLQALPYRPCGAKVDQQPGSTQTVALPSPPPSTDADNATADTARPRDWQSRTSQASSTRLTADPAQEIRDTQTVKQTIGDTDSDPKAKIKRKRAAGSKQPKVPKLSRRAGPAHSSTATANSSRRAAASSAEVMDPDFRPDPAKRPRIVSPWLEPMSQAAERYMRLCSLYPMQHRCSLQQHSLPPQQAALEARSSAAICQNLYNYAVQSYADIEQPPSISLLYSGAYFSDCLTTSDQLVCNQSLAADDASELYTSITGWAWGWIENGQMSHTRVLNEGEPGACAHQVLIEDEHINGGVEFETQVDQASLHQDWCGNMHTDMPGDWPISALCLLNKPSKPPKAPENLRPIALLHPVSKCLATLAAERLRPYVYDLACRFPQFAYVGMRSVEDAIERACAHCATARTVLEGQKYNLHRRREGHTVGHCKGGLTLSLDLSRAFDCLPREVLHASLRFAQVDAELIDLILHIHRHSKLRIDHKDHRILVELHSGVRQRCSLSPALWSIFICYALHLLSSRVPLAALTAFSDDILAQWIIDAPQDVLSALKDMAFIIDTLTSLGMSVSHPRRSARTPEIAAAQASS
ncbi:unnamed protein product [Symbiodinium microadriaticum]|nr:unnamed protein product [Symbiodinium sp. KB8]CAE7261396.1 unnamed protein product [Symbiodinium microadriaticum]